MYRGGQAGCKFRDSRRANRCPFCATPEYTVLEGGRRARRLYFNKEAGKFDRDLCDHRLEIARAKRSNRPDYIPPKFGSSAKEHAAQARQ